MSLQDTVSAERLHIGFFGRRNAGKSSLVNAVTNQALSIVSPQKGTTTDPVKKAMELLPLGPVVVIDTPGIDDDGALGALRVERSEKALAMTDIAVLVVDACIGMSAEDEALLARFAQRKLPYLIAMNKADLLTSRPPLPENSLYVSAQSGEGIEALKQRLGGFARKEKKTLLADLLTAGDCVVLVMPIDEAAPKGRVILPQQQVLRELLDAHCLALCVQDDELEQALSALIRPVRMVITDSQAFARVGRLVPASIPLTSFSILFARYKGQLEQLAEGAQTIPRLRSGERVLICEGCTHHRQCNDIGTVKLPDWIRRSCGAEPQFVFTSGGDFPDDLSEYALIVHCGGCMLTAAGMQSRLAAARAAKVPIVNYGLAIAQMHGLLARSLALFY